MCLFVPQTILTFSAVDEGRTFKLKMLRSEVRAFPVGTAYSYMISRPFLPPRKTCMRMNLDHVASGRLFVSLIIGHWK